ncbi:TIR domain-containing protein [Pseudomonas syringae]|uniref:TIR domain-containing protein n=1 Tax=Pseudomonas syringae TaxID=317 RepID=UPI001F1BE80B|nr:TIR domain-containing protein [Pseudomonas syringae]
MKRKAFYSFHFDNDVMRVQQIRRMGALEGDEPVSPNTWEQIKRTEQGVKNWIDQNLNGKYCLVVLIGSQTANRPWFRTKSSEPGGWARQWWAFISTA